MLAVGMLVAVAVLVAPRRGLPVPARPGAAAGDGRSATVADAAGALTLLAAALRGGAGALECLEAVSALDPGPAGRELAVVAAAHRWGESSDRAWDRVGPGWAPAAAAWHAALAAGAAPAGLVEAAADRMRLAEARRVESAVHRAGVLLVLPLGLCFLPGFVATTVVPVVLLLLGSLR
ncbi:type II secretion system F family protein [Phycicoccus avicenniae]|uniref:type II secretion system F family protein n=1 Tax=Phycicoccus avicenniae TaxID=2828860 RepID=UPI003D28CECB